MKNFFKPIDILDLLVGHLLRELGGPHGVTTRLRGKTGIVFINHMSFLPLN
jgi:hypothetical protein